MTKLLTILFLFLTSLIYSQEMIPSEDLRSDAVLLWQAINELHPGTYRHIDTIELQQAYELLLDNFSTDKSPNEAFKHFSAFIVKLKCGHTYLNPYNQPNNIVKSIVADKVLLPFTFSIINRQIVVDQSLDTNISSGDFIKCINDIMVDSILDSLSNYIKADGNRINKKIKDLEVSLDTKYNYFDYYFPLLYSFKDSVSLEYDDGTVKKTALLSSKERDALKKVSSNYYDDFWSYSFGQDYAYLKLGTFVTWKMSFDWEEYLENFFQELKKRNINSLIIDIRDNEGGMTEVSDYLTNQLASKEGFSVSRRKHLSYKKVSNNLRPHLSTWSRWFYNTSIWTKKLDNRYRTPRFSKSKTRIKKNRNAFRGDTYLLINEANSSATFSLAENCKANSYAILVGTETGGTKMGINGGQIFFLKLPNTKIEVDIPLIGYYPDTELPDEGIKPDKSVSIKLEDFKKKLDTQLIYILDLIENK